MSVRVMSWVWEHSTAEPTDRLVLLAIADCANDTGAEAYPSMAKLATKTGLHSRSVQRSLGRLVASGELVMHKNAGPKGCNRYRVTMTPGAVPPPTESHPGTAPPRQDARVAESRGTPGTAPPPPRHTVTPTPGTPPPEPSLNHPLTVKEPSVSRSKRFDEFWETYPRKAAKDAGRRAWDKAVKRADPVLIIAGAERYRADPNREAQFTKYPATWLNDGCWDDEALPARASPNGHVQVAGLNLDPVTARRMTADRQRLAAMDAEQNAIEGPK